MRTTGGDGAVSDSRGFAFLPALLGVLGLAGVYLVWGTLMNLPDDEHTPVDLVAVATWPWHQEMTAQERQSREAAFTAYLVQAAPEHPDVLTTYGLPHFTAEAMCDVPRGGGDAGDEANRYQAWVAHAVHLSRIDGQWVFSRDSADIYVQAALNACPQEAEEWGLGR